MRVAEVLAKSEETLKEIGVRDFEREARFITSSVCNIPASRISLASEMEINGAGEDLIRILKRRKLREPLQLIMGSWDFFGREFLLEKGVLVPRMETEVLVGEAITRIRHLKGDNLKGLEIGSGSGVVSLTLLCELEHLQMTALDLSNKAVDLTEKNANVLGVRERIDLVKSDYRDTCWEGMKFDFLISNPPYLSRDEFDSSMPEVRFFEPQEALVGGTRGLEFIEGLIPFSTQVISGGGYLFLEIGWGQGEMVKNCMLSDKRLKDIEILDDMARIPRVAVARRI